MAIKAHVTFSQKLGQPDYGSVGVGCSLEIELDASLLERDPDEFRGQLGLAYLTCRQAVEQQLAVFQAPQRPPARAGGQQGNNHAPLSRPATQSQQRALWAICNRSGLNLEAICLDEFDVQRAAALDIRQASSLIDKLKMQTETAGAVR
jgi:hypothetical protein